MTDSPRHWIFQANPEVFDLVADLQGSTVGGTDDWSVSRYADEISPGDNVVLWSSGPLAGAYALGEVSSDVYERPATGFTSATGNVENAVNFTLTQILDPPLLRERLLDDPTLKDLAVIRAPQATNFIVTDEEWSALLEAASGARQRPRTWWVNQGATYRQEADEGIIWAPKQTKSGSSVQHHTNVAVVRTGDVVINYSNTAIRALSGVTNNPTDAPRPDSFTGDEWQPDGRMATLTYHPLDKPIQLEEIPAQYRVPEAGPFTKSGGVKQGYLYHLNDTTASTLKKALDGRWPDSSPWASRPPATHLLFKWNTEREPQTVHRHKEVADQHDTVWWGKFGNRARASLSAANINKIRKQLDDAVPTYVFLYRPGETWRTQLKEITDNPQEVDEERFPDYYTKDECELFVRIGDFEQLEPEWPVSNLVLANNPQPEKTPGALRNQRTPLMVQLATADTPAPGPSMSLTDLAALTGWSVDQLEELVESITTKKQVVLAGPPGTGKTWVAKHVALHLANTTNIQTVQFHPSYGYEEFIEGLRPTVDDNGQLHFTITPGVVRRMASSIDDPAEDHILVIDEMNRANLSKVFGELMYLFEYRDEPINLQYTRQFSLPPNLLFIGTMNTADRSIRSIDIALRRRFDVYECPPDSSILSHYYDGAATNQVANLVAGFEALNAALTSDIDRHHTIGHTFFMHETMTPKRLSQVWDRQLRPLIDEYFFDQPDIANEYTLERFWPG